MAWFRGPFTVSGSWEASGVSSTRWKSRPRPFTKQPLPACHCSARRIARTESAGHQLEVRVKAPETTHLVTVSQIQRWCDGVAVSPDEVLKRRRVKELLGK